MTRTSISKVICSICIVATLMIGGDVIAASLDTIQILKISPQDQRAVIKTPDGKMQVIKLGDVVGGAGKVTEITRDRVVVEEKSGHGQEKVIFRLEDGKQRVERIQKGPEKQPHLLGVKTPHGRKVRNL